MLMRIHIRMRMYVPLHMHMHMHMRMHMDMRMHMRVRMFAHAHIRSRCDRQRNNASLGGLLMLRINSCASILPTLQHDACCM
jgi:hypothetical protein